MNDAPFREVAVPDQAAGMRLDRFLALRFADRSRSFFAARIRCGEIRDEAGRVLAASHRVGAGEVLQVFVAGIAPDQAPPPFPPIVLEHGSVVALDKPPGLLCHPTGTRFRWAVISLAKQRWPADRVDLVHRLDRDTSGVLLLTRSVEANRHLKAAVKRGDVRKEYEALVKGAVPWDQRVIEAPIGPADGPIRIQMAVRADGLPARTDVRVVDRRPDMTRVRCRIHTGRTHQIRVHLAHVGHGLVGDRLYGVPPELFLDIWENGVTDRALAQAGAPRHALHARRSVFTAPDGVSLEAEAPFPADLERLWREG